MVEKHGGGLEPRLLAPAAPVSTFSVPPARVGDNMVVCTCPLYIDRAKQHKVELYSISNMTGVHCLNK